MVGERTTVVSKTTIQYKGLCDPKELFKLIDKYLKDKGYDKGLPKNEEYVTKTHKRVYAEMKPWKKLSDYAKAELKLILTFDNLVYEDRKLDGTTINICQGDITVDFIGYLITDYEGKWSQRPTFFFIRTLMDKYVYRDELARMESIVTSHVKELKDEVQSYLNMHRWS